MSIEDDIDRADFITDGVHPAAAFRQWDIFYFWNEKPGIVATIGKFGNHSAGDFTGVGVFTEETVRTALAGSVGAVSIVNKNYHSAAYKFRQSPIPVTK